MKVFKTLFFVSAILIQSTAFAQNSEERLVRSFNSIKVGEAIKVYLKSGPTEKVVVETSGVSPDEVLTDVAGGKLRIEMKGNRNYRNISVTVQVTFTKIESMEVSSAAKIISNNVIIGDELSLSASSAGSMALDVEVEELEIEVSSSGNVELTGRADFQKVEASSAGGYDGFDLISRKAKVSAGSAGRARVNVTEDIDASASSGGSIRYKGSPEYVDTKASSGGSVKRS